MEELATARLDKPTRHDPITNDLERSSAEALYGDLRRSMINKCGIGEKTENRDEAVVRWEGFIHLPDEQFSVGLTGTMEEQGVRYTGSFQ